MYAILSEMNNVAKRPRRFLSAFTTLLFVYFLVSAHHFSIVYVNSSFLGTFFTPETVSALFAIAGLLSVIALAAAPFFASRVGVWLMFALAVPTLQLSVFFLGFAKTALEAALFFTMQAIIIFILRYLLDLYLESLAEDESKTGNTRGLYNTAGNIGVFLGPLIASVVVVGTFFAPLYALSALLLTPVFFIALGPLRRIAPRLPAAIRLSETVRSVFICHPDVRRIMFINFLTHIFNAAIVIYAPLYLFEVGMLSWQTIGTLTALALLPYLFIEIPLGFLADRFIGEKELTIAGLIILGVAMAMLTVTPLSLFFVWSLWFVAIRIGGATLEIATESYFFKQVTEQDAPLIGMFKVLWPLGGIAAPMIALVVLPFIPLSSIFAVFGAVFLTGIPFAFALNDTR